MTPQQEHLVRRTAVRMADVRELLYFDDSPGYADGTLVRDTHDTRDLPPVATTSTMRFDVLTGEWVALAAHRMDRTFKPPADLCPLCPTRPGRAAGEVPADDYDVVVFENRFPSLSVRDEEPDSLVDGDATWPERAAAGLGFRAREDFAAGMAEFAVAPLRG